MRGLGKQRDRVRPPTARRFDHGERQKQGKRRAQAPFTGTLRVRVVVPAMAVCMVIVMNVFARVGHT
ncbi:MAG: hypothetical protein NVS9B2_13580 [Steroidobacteraceae bacterium]